MSATTAARFKEKAPRITSTRPPLVKYESHEPRTLPTLDGAEHVLDQGSRLGNALVTQLLELGQLFVALALPLDLVVEAVLLQPGFTFLGPVAPLSIDVPTRVARIEDAVDVLAVVRACHVGLDPADDLGILEKPHSPKIWHRHLEDDRSDPRSESPAILRSNKGVLIICDSD